VSGFGAAAFMTPLRAAAAAAAAAAAHHLAGVRADQRAVVAARDALAPQGPLPTTPRCQRAASARRSRAEVPYERDRHVEDHLRRRPLDAWRDAQMHGDDGSAFLGLALCLAPALAHDDQRRGDVLGQVVAGGGQTAAWLCRPEQPTLVV